MRPSNKSDPTIVSTFLSADRTQNSYVFPASSAFENMLFSTPSISSSGDPTLHPPVTFVRPRRTCPPDKYEELALYLDCHLPDEFSRLPCIYGTAAARCVPPSERVQHLYTTARSFRSPTGDAAVAIIAPTLKYWQAFEHWLPIAMTKRNPPTKGEGFQTLGGETLRREIQEGKAFFFKLTSRILSGE